MISFFKNSWNVYSLGFEKFFLERNFTMYWKRIIPYLALLSSVENIFCGCFLYSSLIIWFSECHIDS